MKTDKHVISILVENTFGVLSRVVGLFSRRGYNIDSLSVGVAEGFDQSRITVVTRGDDSIIEQIIKQVEKLENTVSCVELPPESSVRRELLLIKVNAEPSKRAEVVGMAEVFRAKIVDVSSATVTIEMTGDTAKIDAFIKLVLPYGVMEIARTGLTALARGMNNEQ